MAVVCANLHGNWLFQVVALNDLLFLVMVDDVINTADERMSQNTQDISKNPTILLSIDLSAIIK